MNPQAQQAAEAQGRAPASAAPPEASPRRPRPTPDGFRERLDPLGLVRLDLQRRSRINLRRHFRRAVVRVGVLAVFDLATFWLLRAGIRALRDHAMAGAAVAEFFQTYLPRGYLSGWQFGAALMASLAVTGNYGQGDRRRDPGRLLAGCAFATALPLWMPLWTESALIVVAQYALTAALVWAAMVANRLTVDGFVAVVRDPRRDAARTLFVGTRDACDEAMSSAAFQGAPDTHVIGWVEVGQAASSDSLGGVAELARILQEWHVETVVLTGPMRDETFGHAVEVALTAGCHLFVMPSEAGFPGVSPTVVWREGQALVELAQPSLLGWQLMFKRAFDLAGALAGLAIIAPVMAVIALLVKLDSPGSVFFRQDRLGFGGHRFRVWKFRTMVAGASDAVHRELVTKMLDGDEASTATVTDDGTKVFKLVNDARVTRVGAVLRRYSLDELPQLFNVVRGEMSLVGPRPPLPYEVERYASWQYDRLQVLPGITGLWQVSGRNRLSYGEMLRLDVRYVREWSPLLDLRILLRTIPVVLFNSGRAA